MNKKCPNCGFREIRQDSLDVQACLRLISTNNLFNQFSSVIADVGVCVAMEQDNATSISGHHMV